MEKKRSSPSLSRKKRMRVEYHQESFRAADAFGMPLYLKDDFLGRNRVEKCKVKNASVIQDGFFGYSLVKCVCNVCFHRRRCREQFVLHRVLSTDVVIFSLSPSLVVELEDPEHHRPASRATVARESK